jgi:copper resistance protein C
MRMLRFASALALLANAGEASAHAFLLKSEPLVGATVTAAKTLRLEFSEALEVGFCGVELAAASGAAIRIGPVHYSGSDRKVLLTDLPQLNPGVYRVTWHAVSLDTHRTEGDFTFTVKP